MGLAKELAKAEGKTMGTIISELVRKALTTPSFGLAEEQAAFDDVDFPCFPRSDGPPVTPELIQRIQDEIDMEDAVPFDFTTGKPRVFENGE